MTKHTRTRLAKAFSFSAMLAQGALAACNFRTMLLNTGINTSEAEIEMGKKRIINTELVKLNKTLVYETNGEMPHVMKIKDDPINVEPFYKGSNGEYGLGKKKVYDNCKIEGLLLPKPGDIEYKSDIFVNPEILNSWLLNSQILGGYIKGSNIYYSIINRVEEPLKEMFAEISKMSPQAYAWKSDLQEYITNPGLHKETTRLHNIYDQQNQITVIEDSTVFRSEIHNAIFRGNVVIENDSLLYNCSQEEGAVVVVNGEELDLNNRKPPAGFPQNPPPQDAIKYVEENKAINYKIAFSKKIPKEFKKVVLNLLNTQFSEYGILFDENHENPYGEITISAKKIDENVNAYASGRHIFPKLGEITFNIDDLRPGYIIHEICHLLFGADHNNQRDISSIHSGSTYVQINGMRFNADPLVLNSKARGFVANITKEMGIYHNMHKHKTPIQLTFKKDKDEVIPLYANEGGTIEVELRASDNDLKEHYKNFDRYVTVQVIDNLKLHSCFKSESCGTLEKEGALLTLSQYFKVTTLLVDKNTQRIKITIVNEDTNERTIETHDIDALKLLEDPLKTQETTPPPGNQGKTGAIIGGILAGIALLASAALAGDYYRKLRNQRQGQGQEGIDMAGVPETRPEAMEIESTTTWTRRTNEQPAPAGLGL